jgi:hypothetical protein
MIQIRNSMFETNSSSADVFCIPSSPSLKIPKEIKMSRLMVDTYNLDKNASVEDKLSFMYNKAKDEGHTTEFIQYLSYKGINVINDVGDTFDYDSYMFGYYMEQKDLDAFLFDSNSMYLDTPNYEEYKNISKNFIVLDIHR